MSSKMTSRTKCALYGCNFVSGTADNFRVCTRCFSVQKNVEEQWVIVEKPEPVAKKPATIYDKQFEHWFEGEK